MDPVITVSRLFKRFGDVNAVDGLSFDIGRNEIFGLLGPNGAGKTTTISMICGLLPPTSGQIAFPGNGDPGSLIGYCPQDNIFYPRLTCLEQLMFIGCMRKIPRGALKARSMEILEKMGLSAKAHSRAATLSGGMKRRLTLCLALVHDPGIVILDEPEAGLDPQSRVMVRDFIRELGRSRTVILTTHNMDEADRLADRVAIMDHGRLLMLDTPSALKKTVGEGDIIEMVHDGQHPEARQSFIDAVAGLSIAVTEASGSLLLKHPGILEHLPAIRDFAAEYGMPFTEIKLRENTLEDVFIHLTGRTLRS